MKDFSNLSKVVYGRTYSRADNPLLNGSKERFSDTITRAVLGNAEGRNVPEAEIKALIESAEDGKGCFAGRSMWMSGTRTHRDLGEIGNCNCFYLSADKWKNWVIAFDLLMLGSGVGFGVESKYVSQLPKIKPGLDPIKCKDTKDADIIVPDSREGWCHLLYRVLEYYFVTGRPFTYSTVCVRGFGEPIKGFGGTASGPGPLKELIERVNTIMQSRSGRKLRPIDCADVLTSIGACVVAGNTRRSAIIIIGDPHDRDLLKAKRWDLGSIPPHRAYANYSVVCSDVDDLHPLFWKTYEAGEPFGVVNIENIQKYGRMGELRPDTAIGVNPCVTGDTRVYTDEGSIPIKYLVGHKVNVWNGEEWSEVEPRITGHNQHCLKITFDDDDWDVVHVTDLTCTDYHAFYLIDGTKVKASELKVGDQLLRWDDEDGCGTYHTVGSISDAGVVDTVYCFNEPKRHMGVFNGVLTGQCAEQPLESGESCCLGVLALNNIKSPDEMESLARLWFRALKRITTGKYHHSQTAEVISRNHRTGLSITGCVGSPLFVPDVLDRVYSAVRDEDAKYSRELGVSESIRVTTCAPNGTMGKVLDCDGCEGIHAPLSPYIIQRVRFGANDPLLPLLRAAGHHIEPQIKLDGSLDHATVVVDFYVKAPDGCPTVDTGWDTWKQLDALKMAQRYWSDNAISATVYYKKEEIPQIKQWLRDNLSEIKTVSFLLESGHGFTQAPKEPISKEQYEKLSAKIKPIDFDGDAGDGEIDSMECAGGACPIR